MKTRNNIEITDPRSVLIAALDQSFNVVSAFCSGELTKDHGVTEAEALQLASHRHYKGGLYRQLFEVKHSETGEVTVIYAHLWPHGVGGWSRPVEVFHGTLEDGRKRFVPLADNPAILNPA